jgi:hypothetical protein
MLMRGLLERGSSVAVFVPMSEDLKSLPDLSKRAAITKTQDYISTGNVIRISIHDTVGRSETDNSCSMCESCQCQQWGYVMTGDPSGRD